jgi:murein DD-endopeptidase MepM/ murein hydrolase activator NlpD
LQKHHREFEINLDTSNETTDSEGVGELAAARRRKVQIGLVIGALSVFGTAIAVATSQSTMTPAPTADVVIESLSLPRTVSLMSQIEPQLKVERARRGDTLASLLARMGISDSQFVKFARSNPSTKVLNNLRSGRFVAVLVDSSNLVTRLDVVTEKTSNSAVRLSVTRGELSQYSVVEDQIALERQVESRVAEIRSTYFNATDAANIPDNVALQISDILGTELDFNKDLRKGDTLRVVYEMLRLPNSLEQAIAGRVLSVELIHRGKKIEAHWFERTSGSGEYFGSGGISRRKSFLRSPLEVSRVTSSFTSARLNPVSRSWSAHKGVDLAAPIGTNIRSSADGVIDFIGTQSGYGKVIVMKHGKRFETLYAHMNEFTEGLKVGSRVKQGDIIGTVGMTGWSTGPHLHYEFKVDGEHIDPMSAVVPTADPLSSAEQRRFNAQTALYVAKLETVQSFVHSASRAARFD